MCAHFINYFGISFLICFIDIYLFLGLIADLDYIYFKIFATSSI